MSGFAKLRVGAKHSVPVGRMDKGGRVVFVLYVAAMNRKDRKDQEPKKPLAVAMQTRKIDNILTCTELLYVALDG